jgi:hypothetical protein
LKSGYTVSDLQKAKAKPAPANKKKPQAGKPGKAAKKAGAAPASARKAKVVQRQAAAPVPEPERPAVDLQASLAASSGGGPEGDQQTQVDSQADEILDQIRSAAVGIKGMGAGGEGLDETALGAAVKGMNLVQLDAEIKDHDLPDADAQLAMEYLGQQFPDEYPHDSKPKGPAVKVPTQEEKDADEKKALLAYAQEVTAEATESRDQVVQDIAEKADRAKLARMGMEGEPVTL